MTVIMVIRTAPKVDSFPVHYYTDSCFLSVTVTVGGSIPVEKLLVIRQAARCIK